ncbi:putative 3-hydroxyisobutyryl-CoA hydrolase-like protein 2, mitochondrial [Cocos nucifera]|uniref:Putative 3-hydroxyisobutyryl-CoA hydrolase-like protein 2, mitochondrial n=1 Tax=Cocos nucifera TaxID=13894 RepID=A0A8K0I0A4_COCNU|nr:putative 3-hydroxyisobutyryl-CoA hydrolase-like protein 2, mitochondrial [Cocos nucifera]
MQSLRALALARRSLPALRVLPNPRTLSTQPFAAQDDPLRDEVLVEGKASARAAILNRPFALNALNMDMGRWKTARIFQELIYVYLHFRHIFEASCGHFVWYYHGGEAGVSFPGTFRIATDKTV